MTKNDKKIINSHRKVTEIGGALMGIGIGVLLLNHITSKGLAELIGLVSLVVGFILLAREQKQWNTFIKDTHEAEKDQTT